MTFGQRLTQARKNKGLTQSDLGKGLGTDGKNASKAVVYGWEKDQHYPRVDQLVLICERLGVTSDFLLFGRAEVGGLSEEALTVARQVDALPPFLKRTMMTMAAEAVRQAEAAEVPPEDMPRMAGNG